jgi:hypothetical protein
LKWIIENVKWIFSGIGVAILSILVGLFYKNKANKSITQSIKSGNNSTNIQGGRNVTMTNEGENNE